MIDQPQIHTNKQIRFGLYGCNMYRTRDLLTGAEVSRPGVIQVAACYDVDHDKVIHASEAFGGTACFSEEQFLDQEMDVVLICLPPHFHASTYARVAERGFDVYLEKPICVNDEDRELLLETSERHTGRCYVGISHRYTNPFLKVAEILKRHDTGRIIGVHHHWMHGPDMMQETTNWRHRLELSGGQLNHHCCHILDWFQWIGGPMESVIASSYTHVGAVLQHEEQELNASFKYKHGGMAVFNFSQHAHASMQFGSVHTENLGIHYAWGKDTYVKVYKTRPHAADEIYEWDAFTNADMGMNRDANQMATFIDAYLNDKPMPCGIVDGIRTYDFAKAIRESCATGQRVTLFDAQILV
jgi:predicted dehydrogenase